MNSAPRVRALSVDGVANHDHAAVATHPNFRPALEQLQTLKLNLLTDSLPSWHSRSGHLHLSFDSIGFAWFTPTMSNLTSLALLSDSNCGYFSKADFSQLFFPRLQVLYLRKFTFSHHWQMKWTTIQGKTLRNLLLYGCQIVAFVRIHNEFDQDKYPIREKLAFVPGGPKNMMAYDATWSQSFLDMDTSLLKLRVFNVYHETDVERIVNGPNLHRP